MTSQISNSVDLSKIQKSKFLENKSLFFSSDKQNHLL